MSFVRFTPVMRFYWDVFRLSYAGHTFLSGCLMFDHACCLPHDAKQDGLREAAFLFHRGSRSPLARSRVAVRLSGTSGSLRLWPFLYGDLDGVPGTRRTENGAGGAALVRLCAIALAL